MGLLYGRAGRLNTKNAGFRPGQSFGAPATLPAPKPAGTGDDGAVAPTDGGSGQAYGWASNVGGRKENQDKVFAAVLRPRGQSVWIGGVFDGHGKEGKAAAEYCRDRVQQILEERVDELLVPDDARVAAVVTVESEALFLFFTSNILLLCGGLYGELYERLYNKVLSDLDLRVVLHALDGVHLDLEVRERVDQPLEVAGDLDGVGDTHGGF